MILVVQGSPDPGSLCAVLAAAYADGARRAGAAVEMVDLAAETFDPVLREGYRHRMPRDPFVERSIELLVAADHLTVLLPVWWAAEPSVLKGWFDRTLVPGVAYRYHPGRARPDRLLSGRTATLVATSHAPSWYCRLNPRYAPARLRSDVLGYCGIKVTSTLLMGGMDGRQDTAERRAAFIERVRRAGGADARRAASRADRG